MLIAQLFRRFALSVALILLLLSLAEHRLPAQGFTPTRFTVVDAGTRGKPDVLLIPGLSSGRSTWEPEAALLAPDFRLHLLQINGFAGQPAGTNATGAMLPAIVKEMHRYIAGGGMHPVVAGHSMGGLLALMLAAKYPGDAAKLVIVDSLPFYPVLLDPAATLESSKATVEAIQSQMGSVPDDQYRAMQPMLAATLSKSPTGQSAVAAASSASDRAIVLKAMVEDMQTDMRPQLAAITAPVLMLYPFEAGGRQGAEPSRIDALYTDAFRAVPHVTMKRMDDSRHFIMFDQPAQFHAAMQAFLEQ